MDNDHAQMCGAGHALTCLRSKYNPPEILRLSPQVQHIHDGRPHLAPIRILSMSLSDRLRLQYKQ
jgi:hypothetical protein